MCSSIVASSAVVGLRVVEEPRLIRKPHNLLHIRRGQLVEADNPLTRPPGEVRQATVRANPNFADDWLAIWCGQTHAARPTIAQASPISPTSRLFVP